MAVTTSCHLCYYHNSIKLSATSRSDLKPNVTASRLSRRTPSKKSVEKSGYLSLVRELQGRVESGHMREALQVFEKMSDQHHRSGAYVWNVVIRGFVDNGLFSEALIFYRRMAIQGVRADEFTFPVVLKACGALSSLIDGEMIHAKVLKAGLDSVVCVGNSMISMYANLGCVRSAVKMFDEMPERNLVSWNSLITGHVLDADGIASLECLSDMISSGMKPDRISFVGAIKACSVELLLRTGKELHCQIVKSDLDIKVVTSLLDMYGKCGEVEYSERLFLGISPKNNVVVWNAMIGAYSSNSSPFDSFDCLRTMQEVHGLIPDPITLLNLLPSCAQIGSLSCLKSVHGFALRKGFMLNRALLLETTLIDSYGVCGKPRSAERIFDRMREKSLITWNSMISAYTRNHMNGQALRLFLELLMKEPSKSDSITYASVSPACRSIRELKQIHGLVTKSGLDTTNTFVSNSLVNSYAKNGELETAWKIFDLGIKIMDASSWNAVIMAYAIHGLGRDAIRLFCEMISAGFQPDRSTFVSLLTSCSISGLANEGFKFFESMKRDFGVDPGIEHYGCIVDLIGRSGDLDRMKRFIDQMLLKPTGRIWGSLLAAARNHGDIATAEFAAKKISALDHDLDDTGSLVLLSNLYAGAEMWDGFEQMRSIMVGRGIERTIGCSFVQSSVGEPHRFTNGDRSHVRSTVIYEALRIVLNGFESRKRVCSAVESHSVRLAVSFGLISTEIGKPVVVRKNTRVCGDCHVALKRISEVTNREFVVGDSKVYHRFTAGICSCADYW